MRDLIEGYLFSMESANVLDLQHSFIVYFHLIKLMCIPSVDFVSRLSNIVSLWVLVQSMGMRWLVSSWLAMVVHRKDVAKGVSHLDLPIEGSVKFAI